MMNQDYMDITGDAFSDMRVLIEGAITLYENYTSDLSRLASQHGMDDARTALNDVGGALYAMRRHIRKLQSAHVRHTLESLDSDDTADEKT